MTEDDGNATKKDLADLEARIDKKLESMSEQMRDIETAMLRAVHSDTQGDMLKFKY